MSEQDMTPQERLRRIEEETAQLDRDIDEAREAVRHAGEADSMAFPGDARGQASAGTVGGDAEKEDEPAADADEDEDADQDEQAPR